MNNANGQVTDEIRDTIYHLFYQLPRHFRASGPRPEMMRLHLDDKWYWFANVLNRTYLYLLIDKEAYWELVATGAESRHHTPREKPILEVVPIGAPDITKDGDFFIYKSIKVHPSRLLRFSSLLKEGEVIDVKTIPLLIERAIKEVASGVDFKFTEGQNDK